MTDSATELARTERELTEAAEKALSAKTKRTATGYLNLMLSMAEQNLPLLAGFEGTDDVFEIVDVSLKHAITADRRPYRPKPGDAYFSSLPELQARLDVVRGYLTEIALERSN